TAELTVHGPSTPQPRTAEEIQAAGADQWALRCFRELDDALLQVRFNHPSIGLLILKTRGDSAAVLGVDEALDAQREHWLANEIIRLQARVLRRLELTARSLFALIDEGSCFAGCLLELALAADRSYML